MTTVRKLLQEKGFYIWTVSPATSISDTLNLMAEKRIGAVLVLDQGKVDGIFSERDFARYISVEGICKLETPIQELMTSRVYTVSPDHTIDECMAIMVEKRIRHLPVIEDDTIIGLISIWDVVKEVVSQRDVTIQLMEDYIMGRGYNR